MDLSITVKSTRRHPLHPASIRVMHWTNAVAMILMIGSGWKIYNDDVLFGWLHFPDWITLGIYAQHGLQWHFFAMWILMVNGFCYLTYGIVSGRLRRKLLPIRLGDLRETIDDALRLDLSHDEITEYNAIQKLLYLGVIAAIVIQVITGLVLWKPVQFSELIGFFGGFQGTRLLHFMGMTAIVGFLFVHVTLALLVPKTLVAMVTGGPDDESRSATAKTEPAL